MTIGLTGKSCSGKNYVAKFLEQDGIEVLDLDTMCHSLYETEKDRLIECFNTTDRSAIASQVFGDSEKLNRLQDILYPALIEQIKARQKDNKGIIVINGALLHRAQIDAICDAIIYVDASFETRQNRAFKRNATSEDDFRRRENAQSDVDFRSVSYRCPVFVINNNGTCSIRESIKETMDKIIRDPDINDSDRKQS